MREQLYAWALVMCGCGFINLVDSCFWDKSYMEKGLTVRIVKKSWKPLGPSSETDDVLAEYQWDVDTAFNSLLHSSYEYEEYSIPTIEDIFKSTQYDKDQDSLVVIHPIFEGDDNNFAKTIINALAMRNVHKEYNVFAMKMNSINNQMGMSVIKTILGLNPKFNEVTDAISPFLVKGIEGHYIRPEQIHLMGYSYSGQLVGYLARFVSLHYHKKISSIFSLDPYTNGQNTNLVHVSADDAEVVHVLHANSVGLGTKRRYGSADFVFNNGNIQPECYLFAGKLRYLLQGAMTCSHLRIVYRFWYLILYPSKFIARQCDSWADFTGCHCETHPTAKISFPITDRCSITLNTVGITKQFKGTISIYLKVKGVHFIRTSGAKPFGLGPPGSSCTAHKPT